jgi:lipid II:glycine glycyltransferase (peptidoglycan interpeptide bridge formation enzyme)
MEFSKNEAEGALFFSKYLLFLIKNVIFFFFFLRFCDEKHSFFDRFPTFFPTKKPPENLEIATAELSKLRKAHEKLQKSAEKHKKSAEKCEKSLESAKIALEKSEFDREKLSERGTCDFFF